MFRRAISSPTAILSRRITPTSLLPKTRRYSSSNFPLPDDNNNNHQLRAQALLDRQKQKHAPKQYGPGFSSVSEMYKPDDATKKPSTTPEVSRSVNRDVLEKLEDEISRTITHHWFRREFGLTKGLREAHALLKTNDAHAETLKELEWLVSHHERCHAEILDAWERVRVLIRKNDEEILREAGFLKGMEFLYGKDGKNGKDGKDDGA